MSRLAPAAVVCAMAIGSILMWVVTPVAWLWIASKVFDSREPTMTAFLVVLGGIVLTMVALGKGLGALQRLHGRLTGNGGRVRLQAAWLRSMRGEREPATEHSVLDVVMVASVGVALVAMAVWFLLFAGSSLPSA